MSRIHIPINRASSVNGNMRDVFTIFIQSNRNIKNILRLKILLSLFSSCTESSLIYEMKDNQYSKIFYNDFKRYSKLHVLK